MNNSIQIPQIPLSERIRPNSLESFFGQQNLVGAGKPISKMIENDSLSSIIFWGPPGTGKTTLAKIISEKTSAEFFQLNAVSSGVKDVREVIKIAKQNLTEKILIQFPSCRPFHSGFFPDHPVIQAHISPAPVFRANSDWDHLLLIISTTLILRDDNWPTSY